MLKKYFLKGVLLVILTTCSGAGLTLELDEAVSLAIRRSAELKQLDAIKQAQLQLSVAQSQLPDPVLTMGLMNVPTDSFDLNQEAMTQAQLGIAQSFPKGRSLYYTQREKEHLSAATEYRRALMKLDITRKVRLAWLELWYWQKVEEKTKEKRKFFAELIEITESMLANNKAEQYDVIGAQLELSDLDNRLIKIAQKRHVAQASLSRWTGPIQEKLSLAQLPSLPKLQPLDWLRRNFEKHPLLLSDSAEIRAAKAAMNKACEQYKPGITTGIMYGIRQGRNLDQSKRADFVSATIKMDLPMFPGNRQTRHVKASQHTWISVQEQEIIDHQELNLKLEREYASWMDYTQQAINYEQTLMPHARQYAQAVLLAYRNDRSDFPTLSRSYVRELMTIIDGLLVIVEREKAKVNLLYLQGNDDAS